MSRLLTTTVASLFIATFGFAGVTAAQAHGYGSTGYSEMSPGAAHGIHRTTRHHRATHHYRQAPLHTNSQRARQKTHAGVSPSGVQ